MHSINRLKTRNQLTRYLVELVLYDLYLFRVYTIYQTSYKRQKQCRILQLSAINKCKAE